MVKILVLYTFTKAHVKCIKNQVTDRAKKVVVNRESSLNGNAFNVVLQGSVGAPVLFIIFGSDLKVNIKLFLTKFVGDMKIDEVRMRAVGCSAPGHLVNCPCWNKIPLNLIKKGSFCASEEECSTGLLPGVVPRYEKGHTSARGLWQWPEVNAQEWDSGTIFRCVTLKILKRQRS